MLVCIYLDSYLDSLCRFDLRKDLHMRRVLKNVCTYDRVRSYWGDPVRLAGR